MCYESLQIFCIVVPDDEYVVNKPLPEEGLLWVSIHMGVFEPTHECVCVRWGHFGPHCGTAYLQEVFSMKVEIIAFEYLV